MLYNIEHLKAVWRKHSGRDSFLGQLTEQSSPKAHQSHSGVRIEADFLDFTSSLMAFERVVDTLKDPKLVQSGPHRQGQWNQGWAENLRELKRSDHFSPDATIPKYFRPQAIERFDGAWVQPATDSLELAFLRFYVDSAVEAVLRQNNLGQVFEFGCGTGHHLERLLASGIAQSVVGLDWAESSQELVKTLSGKFDEGLMQARPFDYYSPDFSVSIPSDGLVLTVASLEQVGKDFGPFLSYLLSFPGLIILNLEPIGEMLGHDPLSTLSKAYFQKRNYLDGYLNHLRTLEAQGAIRIRASERAHFGSFFTEGYSLVLWEVL